MSVCCFDILSFAVDFNEEILKLLIKNGANLEAISKTGATPLFEAVERSNFVKFILYLIMITIRFIDISMDSNKQNNEILFFLFSSNQNQTDNSKAAKILLVNGANPNARNEKFDKSVLHAAFLYSMFQNNFQMIFKNINNDKMRINRLGDYFQWGEEIIDLLIEHGADVSLNSLFFYLIRANDFFQ